MRPDWDEYFVRMAILAASRATCPVRNVGAVFVNPDTHAVLSIGYNGSPRGIDHCGEECQKRKLGEKTDACRAVHAELNGIFNAAMNGVHLGGSTCYLTLHPCYKCSQALIQVGVKRVVYSEKYYDVNSEYILASAGIPTEQFLKSPWWDEGEEIEYATN